MSFPLTSIPGLNINSKGGGTGGGSGAANSFVFRPGGVAAGNVFTTWPSLMAAVNSAPGINSILIDASIAAAHVPAGTWNVDNCMFYDQAIGGFAPTLTFDDGAVLTFQNLYLIGVIFVSNSTTSIATFGGGSGGNVFSQFTGISVNAGKAPFFHVAGNASEFTYLAIGESTIGDGVTPVFQADAPIIFQVHLSDHTILFANATTGTGTIDLVYDSDATIGTPQLAGLVRFPQSIAPQVVYTPAVAGNWETVPAQVAGALDTVALGALVFSSVWIAVAAGATVAVLANRMYAIDPTGALVTLNLPSAPADGFTFLGALAGSPVAVPVNIAPGAGDSIEDPQKPGTFVANPAFVVVSTPGAVFGFKYQLSATRWIQFL
jgi:hypothetical protein